MSLQLLTGGKRNPFKASQKRPSLRAFQEEKRIATSHKFVALSEKIKMYAEMQIRLTEEDITMKREKHAKEMKLLDLQIKAEERVEQEIAMKTEKHAREMKLLDLQIEAEVMTLKMKKIKYEQFSAQ